jgi:16S rRNA (guanine(966)-N(2))-methyltransferase RsmD
MRVIAGSLKGRRLKPPTWEGLRPTSDKLRETLFNILAPRIAGARVLDGYAGTGAVGIEALSRGAAEVVFVERDRRAAALIADNLAGCGIANGYVIIRADVRGALASLSTQPAFDIVALDPPYAASTDIVDVVARAGALLAPEGILVLEHACRTPAPDAAGRVVRSRDVSSGDSGLAFYEVNK